MMTEPMPDDDTLLSPAEAVEWLKVHRGETAMTVNILRQMRHRGAYERCNWAARTVESRSIALVICGLPTSHARKRDAKRKGERATRHHLNPLKEAAPLFIALQ